MTVPFEQKGILCRSEDFPDTVSKLSVEGWWILQVEVVQQERVMILAARPGPSYLSVAALNYLASCPDPNVAAEATRLIVHAAR